MKTNLLNWKTTNTQDTRMLYLTIMRDVKEYCAKGYCEVSVCFGHFMTLPYSLISRKMNLLGLSDFERHIIVDWSDLNSVHVFYRRFISMCCSVNFEQFDAKAFRSAFDEFTQLLQLKSEK